jgi:hypothetical protein
MNKILEVKFGSHLYGTSTENSDLDLKGIYLPTAREIILHKYQKTNSTTRPKREFERNTKDDVDIEIFSLDRYLQLLIEGQTVALDILFAPLGMCQTASPDIWIFSHIYQNRFQLLNKNVNAFVGYARQQAAKYGQKGFRVHALRETLEMLSCFADHSRLSDLGMDFFTRWIAETGNEHIEILYCRGPNGEQTPHLDVCGKKYPLHGTVKYVKAQVQRRFDEYGKRALLAEQNEGVDWKALSHAVRVNCEAQELLETGQITFPRPERDLLLKIKKGEMPYKQVAEVIENGLEQLTVSQSNSILREEPNVQWAEDFLYEIYSNIVKRS